MEDTPDKPEPKAEQDAEPKAEEPKPKAEQDAEPKAEEPKPKAEEPKPKAEQDAEPKAEEPKPKAEEPKPKAEEPKPKAAAEAPAPADGLRLVKAGATFGAVLALLALIGWAARAAMSSPPPEKRDTSRVQAEPPPREPAPFTNAMLGLEAPDGGVGSQLDQAFEELRKSREAGLFDDAGALPNP